MGKVKVLILTALLAVLLLLVCACGNDGNDGNGKDIASDTVKGRTVFVHESNVIFWGYDKYLCSAVVDGSEVSEFQIEAQLTGTIYALAVYNNEIFVSASDGVFKYPLKDFQGSETIKPTKVTEDVLSEFNDFEIYGDKFFYKYGYELRCIPVSGGTSEAIASDVADFEVTNQGVYYIKKNGDLHLIELDLCDLQSDSAVTELEPDTSICLAGDRIYYRDGDDVKAYSISDNESEDIANEKDANQYDYVWANSSYILYEDEEFKSYVKSVSDGTEKAIAAGIEYPCEYEAVIVGNYLFSAMRKGANMTVFDLSTANAKAYDVAAELKPYLDKVNASNGSSTQESSSYDIMEGGAKEASADKQTAYLYANDFLLTMPNDSDWGYTQPSKDSLRIFYVPAANSGFGGDLVTIKAYNMNDTSYTNLPSYQVAGVSKNANKRFVAIYPTDLQCNGDNKSQLARYNELFKYLKKIGEGAVNSPLQFGDSD